MPNTRETFIITKEQLYHNYVNEKLKEAEDWAEKPDSRWTSHKDVMKEIRGKYGV
jgi:hypothetical protein